MMLIKYVSEPHNVNVDVSEPHSGDSSVSEPHTQNVHSEKCMLYSVLLLCVFWCYTQVLHSLCICEVYACVYY